MLTESYDLLAISPCTLVHFSLPIEKWPDLSSRIKMEQHKVLLKEIIHPKNRLTPLLAICKTFIIIQTRKNQNEKWIKVIDWSKLG